MRIESTANNYSLDQESLDPHRLKKSGSVHSTIEPQYLSSLSSLETKSIDQEASALKLSENAASSSKAKKFFTDAWNWIKNKWNGFLVSAGLKKDIPVTLEKSKSYMRAKIKEKEIVEEIEEEFKYIEISQTDPLKAMVDILVKQGLIRQEEAHLLTQKLLQAQSCLKDFHKERMEYKAEIAILNKKGKVIEKVNVGLTAAQVVGLILTGLSVVAYAATMATGGMAAPIAIVLNVANGIVGGAQAVNTYHKGSNKEAMDKLQSKMLSNNAKRDDMQFIMKMDVKDLKKALDAVTSYAEMGQMIIASQYGKN